jgi:hypothetical protein
VLLRLVDDWAYITTSAASARAVAAALQAGFPDYNCVVNPVKTRTSFPLTGVDPPGLGDTPAAAAAGEPGQGAAAAVAASPAE